MFATEMAKVCITLVRLASCVGQDVKMLLQPHLLSLGVYHAYLQMLGIDFHIGNQVLCLRRSFIN